jgi:mono/diheme cytochrome c family protein
VKRTLIFLILIASHFFATTASAQLSTELKLDTGKEIFDAACIACHGPGGRGQPQSILGFQPPATFPDFSDCNGSTRERTFDWKATIHEGGPARAFSDIMPSFSEALTSEQMDKVIVYLRSLCTDPAWPLGEMNLPRPLITEKAFPEDEWVLASEVRTNGARAVSSQVTYEKRFGARNQLEFSAPLNFQQRESGSWIGGIGDLILGYKRTLFHSVKTRSIFSVQGEVAAPTGNKSLDLGSGVTTFEAFGAYGQRLSRSSFVQMQAGGELPVTTDRAPKAVFWRTAIGKTFAQNLGFGRIWTPMTEIIADRELEDAATTTWDIVPQIQVSLSKRQHILANIGVRRPLTNTGGRPSAIMFYVLWDFFDGGLREGW